ncbi:MULTISPECIES: CsbD family protein [Acidiphilium]|uniref:CsbD family protein n=1 Tax=Acidiphilium TaxID=522 RepID=UPI00257BB560|nr:MULTISPECIES: CsbD family protein [Acidiphilium]HQT83752.1 CsbD family protein [Acidiphilium rubrum]
MDEDEIKGAAKDIGGKIKDGVGGLTGDESLQAEGKADQFAGKAQKLYGSAKDTISEAAEAASEAFTSHKPHVDSTGNAYVDDSLMGRASDMIKEQPLLAMLGTAAAGYALAFLLHGRSRN